MHQAGGCRIHTSSSPASLLVRLPFSRAVTGSPTRGPAPASLRPNPRRSAAPRPSVHAGAGALTRKAGVGFRRLGSRRRRRRRSRCRRRRSRHLPATPRGPGACGPAPLPAALPASRDALRTCVFTLRVTPPKWAGGTGRAVPRLPRVAGIGTWGSGPGSACSPAPRLLPSSPLLNFSLFCSSSPHACGRFSGFLVSYLSLC